MLVQQVAARYPGVVSFLSENFGDSKLAERYGVKGYPAVFVDDVLIAAPRDFGYFGEIQGSGRYAPWEKADSQAKFVADLTRMIDLILAGKKDVVSRERAGIQNSTTPFATLPGFMLTDLSGQTFSSAQVSGRIVLVEFWATWCPPCLSTLEWLAALRNQYGDKVAVIALAVESPEGRVRELVKSFRADLHWAITDARTAASFGDITSVPTLFLFDSSGKMTRVFYGAPPDLHQQAEKVISQLMKLDQSR